MRMLHSCFILALQSFSWVLEAMRVCVESGESSATPTNRQHLWWPAQGAII